MGASQDAHDLLVLKDVHELQDLRLRIVALFGVLDSFVKGGEMKPDKG